MTFLAACSGGKFPGYKQTSTGLYYRFHRQDAAARKPQSTDFLKLNITCYLHDSLYYDWQGSESEVYAQLSDSRFAGDLQEAYAMLHVGDSASFYIKADSIAAIYYDQDPKAIGLKPDDYFRYEMKLVEVLTKDEFQANIDRMKKNMMEASKSALQAYVKKENIDVNPIVTGVYVIPVEKGYGRCPVKGERVELDFATSLLDGTPVGSTFGQDEKFTFVLGEGTVIPAWEEIVPKMRLGERVRAIVPYEMAYGEHSVGSIPSYSNLVYDIKLLKIISAEEMAKQAERERKALKANSEKEFKDFLKQQGITNHTPSGLYYEKLVTTEGACPEVGKKAVIKYVAYYLDGSLLGSSDELGDHYDVAYGKGNVLRGLEEGIGLMRVGEKARFVLPYSLAYGANAFRNIPAYSNLIFDVELLDVAPIDENESIK